ncbi:MAG: redox-sensitive transcriptional activator SoxR [Candidatus Eisenbacteria bacterium]
MPEKEGARALLTVGQLAERCGVRTSALRFYESIGLIESVRTSGNQRRYARSTIRLVAVIRAAQSVGLSLEEIKEATSVIPEGRTPTKKDWTRISARWRARLDERVQFLERLRDDLDQCIGCGCLSLQSCSLLNRGDKAAERGTGPRHLIEGKPN